MSEKKQEQLKRTVNVINELDDVSAERLITLGEGMAIQKSLAEQKEGENK